MRSTYKFIRYVAQLLAVLAVAGCEKPVTEAKSDFALIAVMPLSGPISYLGQQELAGLSVGVDEVNAAGGIQGKKLNLIVEDTQGQPKNAVTIAQKYASRDDILSFVVTTSKAVKAVAPILEPRGIPLAAIASDPDITSISPIIFRPYMSFDTEAKVLSELIQRKGWQRVAFIRGEDEVFTNEVKALSATLPESTKRIVADETYGISNRDFRIILQRVASTKPDAIVALCWGFEVAALLEQKHLDSSLSDVPLVGGYAFLTDPSLKDSGDLIDGNYVVAFDAAFGNRLLPELRSKIEKQNGFRPNQFLDFASTYDLPFILARALSDGSSASALLSRIKQLGDFEGAAGRYRFDGGLDARLPLSVGIYSKGALERALKEAQ